MSPKVEAKINITGRVQGVGFRPFIYRMAVKNGLTGYVINLGDAGVEIIVEGSEKQVNRFLEDIRNNAPEVSNIEDIHTEHKPYRGRFQDFIIDKSKNSGKVASGIYPPDIGICPECLRDMEQKDGRWYNYPFTACAWCGPRFTSVKALPYDRERTHMHPFLMCKHCKKDYLDPQDRRFDAQGITCRICGPKMTLYDKDKEQIYTEDIFRETAKLLKEGNIVAVKGIGGIHLASLATRDDVIEEFRRRKRRPFQPFALMSPDLDAVKRYAELDRAEEDIIQSWRKPVVLIRKKHRIISELVAPGLDRVGVMLPYTGVQTLLFKHIDEPALVMTSGNKRGLPMVITNEAAFDEVGDLADYFLLHNRDIVNRSDDSVLRLINGRPAFTRRSRGYVPDPIDIPLKNCVAITVGAELRNSAAITSDGKVFMTQFLGDIDCLEGLDFEKQVIQNMRDLLNITRNPDVMGCDLHPEYMTSQYAEVISHEICVPLVKSQHHHAHITSVMAENNVSRDEEIIGLALDGAGYGTDGLIWGGEVLKSAYSGFERLGCLENLPMPGGDLCAYNPYRMLIAGLTNAVTDDIIRDITENHVSETLPHGKKELEIILSQSRKESVLKTSSTGRVLDSIAALLGITYRRNYEGEAAMKLETLALMGNHRKIEFEPEINITNGLYVLNTSNMLYYLLNRKIEAKYQNIAAFGQYYLSKGLSEIAIKASDDTGITKIGLSGGVFVNEYIAKTITSNLEDVGLTVLHNKKVPPGDGGIALGQACIAIESVI
ncbi:MAG: carbamoyltransferase HypF [Candidatus Bathyarchaeota archaeon]|nr:carbamoyltransferase HypF [Candidatus Bathyarchaeota archaeon]